MINAILKRVIALAGLGAVLSFIASVILAANLEIKSFDIWLHMAAGKFILTHGYVPAFDIFSSTIQGFPWVNHEGFFQLWSVLAFSMFGVDGLIQTKVVAAVLTFVGLMALGMVRPLSGRANLARLPAMILLLLCVLSVYKTRLTIRPDLFTLLFFTIYLFILSRDTLGRKTIWMLCALQIVWVNTHGFFFLGPLLVLITYLSEWAKRRLPLPLDWKEASHCSDGMFRRLGLLLLCSSAVCLVNPYLIKGALYPLKAVLSLQGEGHIFFQHIEELVRPLAWNTLLDPGRYLGYKILIAVSLLSFIVNYRRVDFGVLVVWLIFLVASLCVLRSMVLFAFVAYWAFWINAYQVDLFRRVELKGWTGVLILGGLMLITGYLVKTTQQDAQRKYFTVDGFRYKSVYGGFNNRNYPHRAVDFLEQNEIKGNILNDFNSGAYLIGQMSPDIKVFIDGRTEMYGAEFFEMYHKIWLGDKDLLDQVIDEYDLTIAFLNATHVPPPPELLKNLYADPEWKMVYLDGDGVIFLKNVPAHAELIQDLEINFRQGSPYVYDIHQYKLNPAVPKKQFHRAYALAQIGQTEIAKKELNFAIEIKPDYMEAYKLLGKMALEAGAYQEAFRDLRYAYLLKPNDTETRYHLARAYGYKNRWDKSEAQCHYILQYNPGNTKALVLLTSAYMHQQKYDAAVEIVRYVLALFPDRDDEDVRLVKGLLKNGTPVQPPVSSMYIPHNDPEFKRALTLLEALESVVKPE